MLIIVIILEKKVVALLIGFVGGASVTPETSTNKLLPLFGTGIIIGALVLAVGILIMNIVMETLFKPICYCAWKEATRKK